MPENFLNLPYPDMTDEQLRAACDVWTDRCATSPGWASAYFSARQIEHCCSEAARRGFVLENKFPIKRGG